MLRLKANKTSLYMLVHYYEPLPKMRQTEFSKAPRSPDYWLTWTNSLGLHCRAFFSVCGGKPLLSIQKIDDGKEVFCEVHDLDLADLRERGMVEKVVRSMYRRLCFDAGTKKSPGRLEDPPGEGKQGLP